MIECTGLGKSYGTTRAVDNMSFTIPDGVVTGFLGPNGSGKSTSMRLMLGLDFGEGTTLFDGRKLADLESTTKVVGAHLDAKNFHPTRTARDHLRMLGQEAQVSNARVDEVIDLLGLASVANKAPGGFSLGMGQRLGLAGAILASPKTLLLDEPANGLDPQSIHWLRDFLRDYAAEGNSVFVSSHLLSEMELLADHLVVIAKGRLMADESMDEFVARSKTDVLVRTVPEFTSVLSAALRERGAEVLAEDGAFAVSGVEAAQIGMMAHELGAPVLELTVRQASLEQAFLEITEGQQGFRTGGSK
ncbi:MAG: ATP-binding cassette domain-containing protein [Actinomycetes bacterium]